MNAFGLVGVASMGPVMVLLIYGILSGDSGIIGSGGSIIETSDSMGDLTSQFLKAVKDVLVALIPLLLVFTLLQKFFLHYSWKEFKIMFLGVFIAGGGMTLFLTAVFAGFIPMSTMIGRELIGYDNGLILLAIGLVFGFLSVLAEPAMKILGNQAESISDGMITKKTVIFTVAVGVSSFIGLGLYGLMEGWMTMKLILPIYACVTAMVWFMDRRLIGLAFDAGAVAAGPMSVAVVLTLYTTVATSRGIMDGVFGAVSLIAVAPIFSLSVLGVYIHIRKRNLVKKEKSEV
jgi:hypothetical protein